jgi:hypothetical protein
MILKNGKFYDGDKEVALEFGNKEQIALLDRVQDLIKNGEESNVFIPEIHGASWDYKDVKFNVLCVCGEQVEFPWSENMNGKKKTCPCGLRYVCFEDDECMLTIKLKP